MVAKCLMALGEAFGRTFTEGGLKLFLESLSDLNGERLVVALKDIAMTEHRMPTIADIRRRANPEEAVTGDQEAIEAANRIVQAMGKFGYLNPEPARNFIGELGWAVVVREGGWQSLCERTSNDELPILKAQWRELAKAIRAMAKAGKLDQPPTLTGNQQKQLEEK